MLPTNLKNPMIRLEMLAKEAEITWKEQKRKLHSSHPQPKEMRNKKWNVKRTNQNIINIFQMNSIMHRSSQQIMPKHNRYIEQCDILKNREYEENLYKTTFLTHFSSSRESWKSTYMLITGGTRHPDQMKRRENKKNIPWKNTIQRKSNTSHKQSNKWQIKSHT